VTKCRTCGVDLESTPGPQGALANAAHTGRELSEVMTVLMGHYDLALEQICYSHRARPDLEKVREYAGRAADLVHRLQVVASGGQVAQD
jgi:hypothetical protein